MSRIVCFWRSGGCAAARAAAPGWSWQAPATAGFLSLCGIGTRQQYDRDRREGGQDIAKHGWRRHLEPLYAGTTVSLISVSFTDANTGTAVGPSGTILRTTDGGETWISQWDGPLVELLRCVFH